MAGVILVATVLAAAALPRLKAGKSSGKALDRTSFTDYVLCAFSAAHHSLQANWFILVNLFLQKCRFTSPQETVILYPVRHNCVRYSFILVF